ncbi:serine/threonine-protein kinase 11-interacting protein-like isoform X2 [Onthophagus taurus]|uniref:serine/threonine-protein kinase 11-interacting protein-like isoform X2 n=1 Tax=Onthophagus taurus TaxID=166361 RepID=UPI0039BE789B
MSYLKEAEDLSKILKENGDEVLNATSKLCISSGLLRKMNESFKTIFNLNNSLNNHNTNFHVLPQDDSMSIIDQFLDIHLLYDFVQKTIGLKLFSDNNSNENESEVDISIFRNLKLLEVRKLSLNLLRGLKNLRTQLEYLICIKTMNNLKEVFENCGGDSVQGYVWNELKQVVFSHNGIDDLDASLEFLPQLNSIDLSHNQIQNADYINCLSNLNYLNLSFNCLTSIPNFSGELCTKLQTLIIRNNYIDDIKEISVLVNLKELDLSDNCLIDHVQLYPITNLLNLSKLNLNGNPLSYHPLHRNKTAMYLHIKSPESFKLENSCLNKTEIRLLATLYPIQQNLTLDISELSSSTNSINTLSTVIPLTMTMLEDKNDTTSDFDSNNGDFHESLKNLIVEDIETFNNEECVVARESEGMEDSGFDAGHRPDSPIGSIDHHHCDHNSQVTLRILPLTIVMALLLIVTVLWNRLIAPTNHLVFPASLERTRGARATLLVVADVHRETVVQPSSAGSLQSSNEDTIKYCESDIEILSNPSQSSIEVISNRSCPRFLQQSSSAILTHHTVSDPCTKSDLKKPTKYDMRKSL